MNILERISAVANSLPESMQQEILDFAEYLKWKIEERGKWNNFSINTAMKDMENEDSNYSLADLKENF